MGCSVSSSFLLPPPGLFAVKAELASSCLFLILCFHFPTFFFLLLPCSYSFLILFILSPVYQLLSVAITVSVAFSIVTAFTLLSKTFDFLSAHTFFSIIRTGTFIPANTH